MLAFNKHFRQGKRTAKRFVKIMHVDESVRHDPQQFLERVYVEAVKPQAKPLTEGLNFATSNITDFEQQIETYSKEKDDLIAKLSTSEHHGESTKEESEEMAKKLRAQIDELDEKIRTLNVQLADAKTKQAQLSASEKPEQKGAKLNGHIKALYNRMTAASKELSPLSFYLLLVIVDYCIAFSFFKDFAQGLGSPAEQIIGYVLPLIITLMSMILMQMVFDRIRKMRTENQMGGFSAASAVIPGLILAIIVCFLLFVRISQDSDNIILESLIWLLYVSLVFVVGYKMDREGKDAKQLIWLPLNILINLVGLVGSIIAWPFENIALLMSREKHTPAQLMQLKLIEDLKARINEHSVEKKEREAYLVDVPKLVAEGKIRKIDFDRKQRAALIEPEIRKRDSLINRARINLNKHKEAQKEFNDHLIKLRMGSDHGAMSHLHKELRKIRKIQQRAA